jgi:hypothetical protein
MIMLTTEQIKEIADQLDCGFSCFLNKNKNELLFPRGDDDEFLDFGDEDPWADERKKIDKKPGDYLEIEKMDSHDSFRIMEAFAYAVDSKKLQNELIYALNQRKPFSKFKYIVDNSGDYRQQWFDFKAEKMQEWVKEQVDMFNRGGIDDDDE